MARLRLDCLIRILTWGEKGVTHTYAKNGTGSLLEKIIIQVHERKKPGLEVCAEETSVVGGW